MDNNSSLGQQPYKLNLEREITAREENSLIQKVELVEAQTLGFVEETFKYMERERERDRYRWTWKTTFLRRTLDCVKFQRNVRYLRTKH